MHSITKSELALQFMEEILSFVQSKLELLMRLELDGFLEHEYGCDGCACNSRNGFYTRDLDTRYGKIRKLRVPRDRKGRFHTRLFTPYSRRDNWLEEAIISMYKGGMSTREVAEFVERVIGTQYSPATISNITSTVLEDVEKWRNRPLRKRYSVLYVDGLYVPLRRDTVEHESIYIVMGIDEDGHRQILGFYVGGQESATVWKDIFMDLCRRGVEQVLICVGDGLAGLKEAFLEVFPKADFQRCVVHKLRNTIAKVRVKDRNEMLDDLKGVYTSDTIDQARSCFDAFERKWYAQYPREVQSWRNDLDDLLQFYKYPAAIRYALYTTNAIERTIKEIRKRVRPMNSLANVNAAEKITYLFATGYNDKWSKRSLRGFADPETKNFLSKMFNERYGNTV